MLLRWYHPIQNPPEDPSLDTTSSPLSSHHLPDSIPLLFQSHWPAVLRAHQPQGLRTFSFLFNSLTASKSQLRCYLLRELPHPHYSGFQPLPRSLLRTGPTYFPVSVGKHAKRLHPQPVFAGWFYVNLTQAVVPERRAPQLRKCLYKTELQASL